LLIPRETWADQEAFDRQATALARMFVENFALHSAGVDDSVVKAGPSI
jgi:phosphoenolpyruvate carboxykinase (ATP)